MPRGQALPGRVVRSIQRRLGPRLPHVRRQARRAERREQPRDRLGITESAEEREDASDRDRREEVGEVKADDDGPTAMEGGVADCGSTGTKAMRSGMRWHPV